jgi:hypothetical protein
MGLEPFDLGEAAITTSHVAIRRLVNEALGF